MAKNSAKDVKDLNDRIHKLSGSRTRKEAYELAERVNKKRRGSRMYKNYNSYKSAMTNRKRK